MLTIQDASVGVLLDVDQCEGWIIFTWKDPKVGKASLQINVDGYCSREMPIRSTQGPPESLVVAGDCVTIDFTAEQATDLQLAQLVEFHCTPSQTDFQLLLNAIDSIVS